MSPQQNRANNKKLCVSISAPVVAKSSAKNVEITTIKTLSNVNLINTTTVTRKAASVKQQLRHDAGQANRSQSSVEVDGGNKEAIACHKNADKIKSISETDDGQQQQPQQQQTDNNELIKEKGDITNSMITTITAAAADTCPATSSASLDSTNEQLLLEIVTLNRALIAAREGNLKILQVINCLVFGRVLQEIRDLRLIVFD